MRHLRWERRYYERCHIYNGMGSNAHGPSNTRPGEKKKNKDAGHRGQPGCYVGDSAKQFHIRMTSIVASAIKCYISMRKEYSQYGVSPMWRSDRTTEKEAS